MPVGAAFNIAAIQTLWTGSVKPQLAAYLAAIDAAAVAALTLEQSLIQMDSLCGPDIAEWVHNQMRQRNNGYKPFEQAIAGGPGGPARTTVYARDPVIPQDLSQLDLRPVTSTLTAQICQLS
jgi:hypothetical protein